MRSWNKKGTVQIFKRCYRLRDSRMLTYSGPTRNIMLMLMLFRFGNPFGHKLIVICFSELEVQYSILCTLYAVRVIWRDLDVLYLTSWLLSCLLTYYTYVNIFNMFYWSYSVWNVMKPVTSSDKLTLWVSIKPFVIS